MMRRTRGLRNPGWLCLEGNAATATARPVVRILNHGFRGFDLMSSEVEPFACPQCYTRVVPTTYGFNNCTWRYKGREAGETNILVGQWKEAGNSFHRIKEDGSVKWESCSSSQGHGSALRREVPTERLLSRPRPPTCPSRSITRMGFARGAVAPCPTGARGLFRSAATASTPTASPAGRAAGRFSAGRNRLHTPCICFFFFTGAPRLLRVGSLVREGVDVSP